MASSMIHLAITEAMIKQADFQNFKRLRLGAILPDGAVRGNSHLKKKKQLDGELTFTYTYDLEFYRSRYQKEMKTDDLYLGYYLHLIQDTFYRKFIYGEHHWDSRNPENVKKLHRDYEITNCHVAQKYGLSPGNLQVIDLTGEPITELADFDVPGLVKEVSEQFVPVAETDIFFFSKEMAEELVECSIVFCLDELRRLKAGKAGLNSMDWSWKIF